jgi:transcriptional regulator with XRE-family HTH domain
MTTAGQLTESSAAAGIRGGAVTDEANRRTELGRFLRNRRERIDPSHAGFPLVGRRRTSGLRREEVAVLAGVSTTWYTYLEQGRNKNVSKAVLNSVAGVLQLSDDEIRYMHFLAYGQMHDEVVTDLMGLSATDLLSKVVATADRHPRYPWRQDRIRLDRPLVAVTKWSNCRLTKVHLTFTAGTSNAGTTGSTIGSSWHRAPPQRMLLPGRAQNSTRWIRFCAWMKNKAPK